MKRQFEIYIFSEFNKIKSNFLNININSNFNKNILSKIIMNDFPEIKKNQLVVHLEHGIGKYYGLKIVDIANVKTEYCILLYANEIKLYVPSYHLHLIYYYNYNIYNNNVTLSKLSDNNWIKERKKISKKIYNTAIELLNLYNNRKSIIGYSFKKHSKKYEVFANQFTFKTTKDQEHVINTVINDMYKSYPMDRIICGDVGFGKTEIAMRAAFIAISNNKQVVVLSPTTLLVQQHFKCFKTRFSKWSTKINALSRLSSFIERKSILDSIEKGLTNIVIATHQLLFLKVKWKNIGLLIIDEEHRFGVLHKEQIKKNYSGIDVLTLTATPIPRTLNMAIIGLRDVSVINTPPSKRLSIKTFVSIYSDSLIRKKILKEILRGGQVFYVHNKIKTISKVALHLSKLVPEANIKIAHGKMSSDLLKKIMNNFSNKKFNVLVCTTIIEIGINMPSVNTIFIENSNHFGLAQLHQLRGRVGRSNNQAYAWLLVSNKEKITETAKKRLQSIVNNSKIGSGFNLSSDDLEMRGVGSLLGNEQSGHIENIGNILYMKILKETVHNIKKNKKASCTFLHDRNPNIELNVSTIFPEHYIKNTNQRFCFYRLISNVNNISELVSIKKVLINTFGNIPHTTINLIKLIKIQLISKKIGIKSIKINVKGGFIQFEKKNYINVSFLVKIISSEPENWKIKDDIHLLIYRNLSQEDKRMNWTFYFIKKLEKMSTIHSC